MPKGYAEVVEENERQLCRLFSGARSTGHDLLLEITVDQPQTREEQDACLLRWMRRCYELGVYPDYWEDTARSRMRVHGKPSKH